MTEPDDEPIGKAKNDIRAGDYRTARIGAAAALVGVLVFTLVWDALSPAYEASPVILAALLGAIGALLGIEAGSIVRRK